MFKFILVFYLTIVNAACINYSKCKEYIVILAEDGSCPPVKLKEINWQNYSCPGNSEDLLTLDEFYANRSCIIEMKCTNYTKYPCSPSTTIETTSIETTSIETTSIETTSIEPTSIETTSIETTSIETTTIAMHSADITNKTKIIEEDDAPLEECNTDSNHKCKDSEQINIKKENNSVNYEIKLIYDLGATIDSENFNIDKYSNSEIKFSCEYTDNICSNENDDYINKNSTSSINTIIVSVNTGNVEHPLNKYYGLNKTVNNFNCSSVLDGKVFLNRQYVAFTHEIMRKFHCRNSTNSTGIPRSNNLNTIVKHKVNVYIPLLVIHNNKKENYIECAQNFLFIRKLIIQLQCVTIQMPERYINSDILNKTDHIQLIWNCSYNNPHVNIFCDGIQSQKYKLLKFDNCTGNHDITYKGTYHNNNFIVNLHNTESVNINKNNTQQGNVKYVRPFSENLQLRFVLNASSLPINEVPFFVRKGRIFNLWTNDEESRIIKYFNKPSFINIKLSDFTLDNHTLKLSNNNLTDNLKLDIILNKQNNTAYDIFKDDDLNKTEDIHINRAVINCFYPDLMIILNKTVASKIPELELNCDFKYVDDYINKNTSDAANNYISSTENNISNQTELIESTTSDILNTKQAQNSNHTNNSLIEITTDFSVYKYPKVIKMSDANYSVESKQHNEEEVTEIIATVYNSNNKSVSTEQYNNTKLMKIPSDPVDNLSDEYKEIQTTEIPNESTTKHVYVNDQLEYTGVKSKNKEKLSKTNPILYVGAVLAAICITSIIAMIGIKIWKPTYKYYGPAARNNNRDNEESPL